MSQSTESTTESNPFTKPGFIIAAALVVALIAAAVVIFLLPKGQEHRPAGPGLTADPAPRPQPAPAPADAAGKSVCGLPSSTETALGAAPKSKWELVGKMAAPTDPKTFGPGMTDGDGFRSCFAHSPTGALYAAVNIWRLGSSGSLPNEMKLADKLLVPGAGRDAAMQDQGSDLGSSSGPTTVQVSGFSIKSYTPSEANVDLAFKTDNGALGALGPVACVGWTGTGK